MGIYAVSVTKLESGVIYVEAENAPEAERIALDDQHNWEMETEDVSIDDVVELLDEEADNVKPFCITEE